MPAPTEMCPRRMPLMELRVRQVTMLLQEMHRISLKLNRQRAWLKFGLKRARLKLCPTLQAL